jgi:hypothetical protein
MTKTMRKLSTVLVALVVFNSPFASYVLAATNDADEARNVVAAFATTWNRHDLIRNAWLYRSSGRSSVAVFCGDLCRIQDGTSGRIFASRMVCA